MEIRTTWQPRAARPVKARSEPPAIPAALDRIREGFHPFAWIRAYPLVLPTILIALAGLVYMLQVNQGEGFDFRLQQLQTEESQKSGLYADLSARYDRLTSCQHVCSLAVTRFHMIHADLTRALWITVRLPAQSPALPKAPAVQTGPLSWLENAATSVKNSL